MTNEAYVKGKTALVTGANRGIGKAIVETFLAEGAAKIYAGVRDLSSVDPLIAKYAERVQAVHIDLEKPDSVTAAAKQASDVEIVVNNAGVLQTTTPLDEDAIDSLRYEMEINVIGLIRMAQAFAPVLAGNGGGAFIQLNSIASIKNFAPITTYSASKAAAYSVTQGLKDLLIEQGTKVISVHPGPIATDMADEAGVAEMAQPARLVSDSIVAALNNGDFHVFPDEMAKQIESAYQSYAQNIVEKDLIEA